MKALFLGLGGIGQRHLRNLRTIASDVKLAAVRHGGRRFEITPQLQTDADVDIEQKYAIAAYTDLEQAIECFAPNFAVVATPSSRHAEQASQLIRAGVPVLLEKPLAHDKKAMTGLLEAHKQKPTLVMVGYMLRFHPAVQKLREMVKRGEIGRLHSGHIVANTYMPDWHAYEKPGDYYVGQKVLGGGTILTNIHLIDLLEWILGMPQRLWCRGGKVSDLDIDVEDTVSALFDYEINGTPVPVTMNMSFVQQPQGNCMTFRGSQGEIVWNVGHGSLIFESAEGDKQSLAVPDVEWNDLFLLEMSHFLGAVSGDHPLESALEDVTGGQNIALGLKESLEKGDIINP